MPLYLIECSQCGERETIYRHLSEIDDLPKCCGEKTHRVICPPMVMNDIEPYRSMIDGRMIQSRSEHREHLRQHNCIEVGNETKYLQPKPTEPKGLKETLVRVTNEKLRGA